MGNSKSTAAADASAADSKTVSPNKRKADDAAAAASKEKADEQQPATKKAKTKKVVEAPFSWTDFQAAAKSLDVKFGAADSSVVRQAGVKLFSTGSYGWSYHGTDVMTVGDAKTEVPVRIGLNITIMNSKPKAAAGGGGAKEKDGDDDTDAAGGDAADGKADSKGPSAKFKELEKAACPFADAAAFIAAAKPLTISFGAAGAPATSASIAPFSSDAAPKKMSTGSFGWTLQTNKKLEAGADSEYAVKSVQVRVSLNIQITNSKPKTAAKKGKKAAAAAAADDE